MNKQDKWDVRFLKLARHVSLWSKDPSTKVGAIIVNNKKQILGIGYNGLARNIKDDEERYNNREVKYRLIVHAEDNAIINAKTDVSGCTLYSSLFCCCECSKLIVQAGITRVVAPVINKQQFERFKESFDAAKLMFKEANVTVKFIEEGDLQ